MAPELTILLPTRNERHNIQPVLAQLQSVAAAFALEVLFVDDSTDGTEETITASAATSPFPIRLIHRLEAERDGLSGAVVAGLRAARGQWVCVMDADLQHPPALAEAMLRRALATDADVVVASRQGGLGGPKGLSPMRALTSQGLTILARGLFPNLLRNASDPLTGFFLVRRERITLDELRPDGFKILLEILIRCPDLRVTEVHFAFGDRHAGESKADFQEGMRFFRHIMRLRRTANPAFNRSLIVGMAAFLLNQFTLWLLVAIFNLPYVAAVLLAVEAAVLFRLVAARPAPGDRMRRYVDMGLWDRVNLIWRLPAMWLLVSRLGANYLIANMATMLISIGLKYLLSDRWIWTKQSIPAAPSFHCYDVHGLFGLESTVRLPELSHFRTDGPLSRTDIRLSVDRYGTPRCAAGSICYSEGLGRFGYGVAINPGDCTEVTVSPLLAFSPHVLYTSIVEPLLRWAVVRHGAALVHGAGVVVDGAGILVIDPAGQGKSTLVLQAARAQQAGADTAFLADDMILLDADGILYCYPKPLIMRHELRAQLKPRRLNLRERLRFGLQSGLYSRFTHWLGVWLFRLRLPAATLNAVIQILAPPPKEGIAAVAPAWPTVERAPLSHVVWLRHDDGPPVLSVAETAALVAGNIENAFVFPPYPTLALALRHWRGADLGLEEAKIIAAGLGQIQARELVVVAGDWWQTLRAELAEKDVSPGI